MMLQVKNLQIWLLSSSWKFCWGIYFLHAIRKLNIHTKTPKHPTCHKLTMHNRPMEVMRNSRWHKTLMNWAHTVCILLNPSWTRMGGVVAGRDWTLKCGSIQQTKAPSRSSLTLSLSCARTELMKPGPIHSLDTQAHASLPSGKEASNVTHTVLSSPLHFHHPKHETLPVPRARLESFILKMQRHFL